MEPSITDIKDYSLRMHNSSFCLQIKQMELLAKYYLVVIAFRRVLKANHINECYYPEIQQTKGTQLNFSDLNTDSKSHNEKLHFGAGMT